MKKDIFIKYLSEERDERVEEIKAYFNEILDTGGAPKLRLVMDDLLGYGRKILANKQDNGKGNDVLSIEEPNILGTSTTGPGSVM